MASVGTVACYRVGIANLLSNLVEASGEIERRLDIEVDDSAGLSKPEAWQIEFRNDPVSTYRLICVQLLRKARIHAVACIRANENCNVHSLAVQMRPVLECAGQVVHIFHYLVIAPDVEMDPERSIRLVTDYLDRDYYDTLMRVTKDNASRKKLLRTISETARAAAMEFGVSEPKVRKRKPLRQIDKVEMLPGGKTWYRYLGKNFRSSAPNWAAPSWQGGVGPMDITHEIACAGLMHYTVDQMARMNAFASLCPESDIAISGRADAALAELHAILEAFSNLRKAVQSANKCNRASDA